MRAALYIDMDNMLGYCYSLSYQFNPTSLIEYVSMRGDNLELAKSFGSIPYALSHFNNFISESEVLTSLKGVGVRHHSCTGKKNTADLALILDALSEKDNFDVMYIVSSDTDFHLLVDRLSILGKKIVIIRMFHPQTSNEISNVEEVVYHDILGINVEKGLDVKVLVYRDVVESILKMPVLGPAPLNEMMHSVIGKFETGMTVSTLARTVGKKDAYKVIKTTLFGKGFLTDERDRNIILAITGDVTDLRSAYYRQCQFVLRRQLRCEVCSKALNKMFMLTNEHFSTKKRKLERSE